MRRPVKFVPARRNGALKRQNRWFRRLHEADAEKYPLDSKGKVTVVSPPKQRPAYTPPPHRPREEPLPARPTTRDRVKDFFAQIGRLE